MNETRIWVADLLSAFSGQENTLTIPRPYIDLTGSIEDALLLSQIIYWTDRTKMENGWFAKSYAEWQDEIALSKYQVTSAIKRLKDSGVETKVKKFNGAPTVHYRLRKDVFELWIVKKLNERKSRNLIIDSSETSQSLTEPTPEPTPDITPAAKASGRKPEPYYDAIATTFKLAASGQIVMIRSMMQGKATRGTWKDCNFDPPVTDPEEIIKFGAYMETRKREKHITEPITAAATIQRWFYDYRAAVHKAAQPLQWSDIPELRGIKEIIR